jgi:hypothetical protein
LISGRNSFRTVHLAALSTHYAQPYPQHLWITLHAGGKVGTTRARTHFLAAQERGS